MLLKIINLLDTIITSKTRVKLLLKFFLNPNNKAYLRGLSQEFGESTNSIRLELNRFEEAGMLTSCMEGNKKVFTTNKKFSLFNELQGIVKKFVGVDQIIERLAMRLGNLEEVYLEGDLACGKDSKVVDIILVGKDIDRMYLTQLIDKTEPLIKRNIRYQIVEDRKNLFSKKEKPLLIWTK